MKPRVWIFTSLIMAGALTVGYQAGRSSGAKDTRLEMQQFLKDFALSADLETYFRQRGEPQRFSELTAYGVGAPSSRSHGPSSLAGIACVAVGILGLLPRSKTE